MSLGDEFTGTEVKTEMTEMFIELTDFINANSLHYSIAFGTMLGAVRHGASPMERRY